MLQKSLERQRIGEEALLDLKMVTPARFGGFLNLKLRTRGHEVTINIPK